jgi:NitT/TauT family transport system substrate-binding protein
MYFGASFVLKISLVVVATSIVLYLSQERLLSTDQVLPLEKLVLATPQIPFSSIIFLAKHNDLFTKHGLDVQFVITESGKEALELTLAGKADIAAVATLPIVYAIDNGETPRILAVISKSDYEHSVVARSSIASPADLKGKTIGTLAGTSAQFYLEILLTNANLTRDSVNIKNIRPQDSEDAIVSGDVDAVALYSPWDKRAAQALGKDGIVFATSLHTTYWTLTSDAHVSDAKTSAANKMLQALLDAQTLAVTRREASLKVIAGEMDIPLTELDDNWDLYSFEVQLRQSLISTLEREMQWIRLQTDVSDTHQPTSSEMPDFLDNISFTALESVKPSTIRITR